MLKAKDLMCGNYIYSVTYSSVTIVNSHIIAEIEENNEKYFEGEFPPPYKYIAVTEEWLLQMGFNQLDKYTFVKNGVFIYNRKRGFVYGSKNRNLILLYIHQVQNLFKALTNKELTI